MNHGLYCVRDKAADAFLPPFTLPSDNMAVREFYHCALMPDHRFCIHARDFSLYKVGYFDDCTGKVVSFLEPEHMVQAIFAKSRIPLEQQEVSLGEDAK